MTKQKSPARSSKKKRSPEQVCSDSIIELINDSLLEPNAERLSLSKAYHTIRIHEMRKIDGVDLELLAAVKNCKDKILRTLIDEIVESSTLTITDVITMLNAITIEFGTLPIWDIEHSEELESIIMEFLDDKDKEDGGHASNDSQPGKVLAQDVLKALCNNSSRGDGDE